MPRCWVCRSRRSASLGFLGLLAAALARGEWARLSQADARALGVLLQRLPALHPGGRDRGGLPVVPRDRRDHDRDRRPGAPAPPPRRGGRVYSSISSRPCLNARCADQAVAASHDGAHSSRQCRLAGELPRSLDWCGRAQVAGARRVRRQVKDPERGHDVGVDSGMQEALEPRAALVDHTGDGSARRSSRP